MFFIVKALKLLFAKLSCILHIISEAFELYFVDNNTNDNYKNSDITFKLRL